MMPLTLNGAEPDIVCIAYDSGMGTIASHVLVLTFSVICLRGMHIAELIRK